LNIANEQEAHEWSLRLCEVLDLAAADGVSTETIIAALADTVATCIECEAYKNGDKDVTWQRMLLAALYDRAYYWIGGTFVKRVKPTSTIIPLRSHDDETET